MRMRRKTAAALIGVMVLVIALPSVYAAGWFWAGCTAIAGVEAWRARAVAAGVTIDAPKPEMAGFPGRLRLSWPQVTASAAAGGWRWTAERVALETTPWSMTRFRLSFDGPQRLAIVDGAAAESGDLVWSVANGEVVFDRSNPATPILTVTLAEIGAPAQLLGNFPGLTAERLVLEAYLTGAIPAAATPEALAVWRDAGGALKVSRLSLDWAGLTATGAGTLSLDQALRPEGTMQFRIGAIDVALKRLTQAGWLRADAAQVVTMAVALLAPERDDQGRPVFTAPLRLRDGAAWLGVLRLATVSPLLAPSLRP